MRLCGIGCHGARVCYGAMPGSTILHLGLALKFSPVLSAQLHELSCDANRFVLRVGSQDGRCGRHGLGATAVGIGRPQAWGLAALGQSGVEAVLDIFNRELVAIMRQAGTPTLADITGASVVRTAA